MEEISGSYFIRTTTGTQTRPGTFNKSRLVVTFLTNFRVTQILCNFRSILKEKVGKEIPESLSDVENNTSGSLNREAIADLPLLGTLLAVYQKSS